MTEARNTNIKVLNKASTNVGQELPAFEKGVCLPEAVPMTE